AARGDCRASCVTPIDARLPAMLPFRTRCVPHQGASSLLCAQGDISNLRRHTRSRRPADAIRRALLQGLEASGLRVGFARWRAGLRTAMGRGGWFKGRQFTAEEILWAVRWCLRFPVSYRDLELMLQDRGVSVDHTTIFRRIQAYAAELEKRIRPHLRLSNG